MIYAAHIQSSSCNSNNHIDPCSKHTHVHTSIFQTLEQDARQALEDVLQMKADTNMGLIKERVG